MQISSASTTAVTSTVMVTGATSSSSSAQASNTSDGVNLNTNKSTDDSRRWLATGIAVGVSLAAVIVLMLLLLFFWQRHQKQKLRPLPPHRILERKISHRNSRQTSSAQIPSMSGIHPSLAHHDSGNSNSHWSPTEYNYPDISASIPTTSNTSIYNDARQTGLWSTDG